MYFNAKLPNYNIIKRKVTTLYEHIMYRHVCHFDIIQCLSKCTKIQKTIIIIVFLYKTISRDMHVKILYCLNLGGKPRHEISNIAF